MTAILGLIILVAPTSAIEIRGTPGSMEAGSVMHLDGFNFPELIYREGDNQTYEWLDIFFVTNGAINKGDATYKTKMYKKSPKRQIMFMGNKYHILDPDKAELLSKIFKDFGSYDKKMLLTNEAWELDQNYTLTLRDVDFNNDRLALLELAKNGDIVDRTTVKPGDKYEYTTDVTDAKNVTIFICDIDSIIGSNNSANMILKNVIHYSDTPLIIKTGDEFGDFEITSITNNTIEMKNSNTISYSLDGTVNLLDDWLKLKTSDGGYWGYVYSKKECPTCPECPTISNNSNSSTVQTELKAESTTTGSTKTGPEPKKTESGTTKAESTTTEPTKTGTEPNLENTPQTVKAPGFGALLLFAILIVVRNIRKNKN